MQRLSLVTHVSILSHRKKKKSLLQATSFVGSGRGPSGIAQGSSSHRFLSVSDNVQIFGRIVFETEKGVLINFLVQANSDVKDFTWIPQNLAKSLQLFETTTSTALQSANVIIRWFHLVKVVRHLPLLLTLIWHQGISYHHHRDEWAQNRFPTSISRVRVQRTISLIDRKFAFKSYLHVSVPWSVTLVGDLRGSDDKSWDDSEANWHHLSGAVSSFAIKSGRKDQCGWEHLLRIPLMAAGINRKSALLKQVSEGSVDWISPQSALINDSHYLITIISLRYYTSWCASVTFQLSRFNYRLNKILYYCLYCP